MNFAFFKNIAMQSAPGLKATFAIASLALLLPAFISTATGVELLPAERTELMARLKELGIKNPSLKAEFIEQKTSHLLNKPFTSEGIIEFSMPDKFRREVKGNNPSTTVSNGKVLWNYYPKFPEAELYTLGQHSILDDSMQALIAGFSFEHFDEFYNLNAYKEDGGYRLVLTPKHSKLKRIMKELTIWLDAEFTPKKTHITIPTGDEVTTTYRNVERTSLPDSTFEFTPPAGTHISHPLGK